jgi:hypothetical protein
MDAVEMSVDGVSIFTLLRDGKVAGYAAFRPNRYTWKKRRGLKVLKWTEDVVEGSYYLLGDRLATGFSPMFGDIEYSVGEWLRHGVVDYQLGEVSQREAEGLLKDYFETGG